jgi:TolB protein
MNLCHPLASHLPMKMTETSMRLTRRLWLAGGAALLATAGLLPLSAHAQFRVEISGVGATQIPVAIAKCRDESRSPQPIASIIRADLERSGLFKPVDGSADKLDEASRPTLTDWRAKNVDALLAGSVSLLADGRYDVRYRIWDALKSKDLGGQSLVVPAADLRLAAHRIADDLYEKFTGDKGAFATRIAYVSKVGAKYTLLVADADGEGSQAALSSQQPIISPAWAPDGRRLAYVSFEGGKCAGLVARWPPADRDPQP